jgi:MFS family permease
MLESQTAAPAPAAVDHRSIRRFYAFKLTTETQFTGGIWILYLQSRGFSLTEIGLAEASFHLAPVLLELPSGSFADLVGRRWSLAIGALLIALSTALMFVAGTLPLVLLALFLNGASYSFRSGADQAFLYDSLGERQGSFAGILGKLLGASYIVGGATVWLGAALSDVSWAWPYALTVGAGLAGAWLAAGLSEPPPAEERHTSAVRHVHAVVTALRARPVVAGMVLFSGLFWATGTIIHLYLQAAFSDRGLSNGTIGLVLAATMLISAAGVACAGRLDRYGRFRYQLVALAALSGVGHALTGISLIWLAIVAYLMANLTMGLMEPLMFAWLNRQLPSAQRATLLSFDSWMFSLVMIVAFPLGGWLAESSGWGILFALCGGVQVTMALVVAVWLLRRRARPIASTGGTL